MDVAPGFVGAPELPRLARCPHPKPVESEEAVLDTWLEMPTGFGMEKYGKIMFQYVSIIFSHPQSSATGACLMMLDDWCWLSCLKDLQAAEHEFHGSLISGDSLCSTLGAKVWPAATGGISD